MEPVEPNKFAWAILNNFNYLSRKRFYNLAFLIEHEYYVEHDERLTETDYREMLDGMYNEELDETLEDCQRLDFEEHRVAGDKIPVIVVPVTQMQSLPEAVESTIDSVIDEFAEASEKELRNNIKARIPREVNLTSVLDFDELYEEALPFYKRIHR